ncbi:Uricase [Orbilia brochopaga]|nr:Uricase [Drechslerella brochopaga]
MASLAAARYGKDNVRVYKVHRDPVSKTQTVTEMTVCCLLEGDVETSYTEADNSPVVATDTVKNTIYILAKQNPVNPPELFGAILASHFPNKYSHIHAAHVSITVHRWTRVEIDGKPHSHSFLRDGSETRNVDVTFRKNEGFTITSKIAGLLVLKSTGSAFHGFHRDEFTTLKETWDRILSTEVDAAWTWKRYQTIGQVQSDANIFDRAFDAARNTTLKIFAEDNSASVQATMYKMCEKILADVPGVEAVEYALPNKHYFEIDLSWHKGLKNTGKDAEVYAPQSGPNGLIKCRVVRKPASKL